MRFHLAQLLCLLATAEALAIGKLDAVNSHGEYVEPSGDLDTLEKRTKIEIIAAGVTTAFTASLAAIGIADYMATHIKTESDNGDCNAKPISQKVDGVLWQYKATTSGKPEKGCGTTAQLKTIRNAVKKSLDWMQREGKSSACFKMDHGGTWQGNLKISLAGKPIASDGDCDKKGYQPLK